MKSHFDISFRIFNPLAWFIIKWRARLAQKYWEKHFEEILDNINSAPLNERSSVDFKWGQLVAQEIWMYIRLGEKISKKEFDELCKCRGFNEEMVKFLYNIMTYVGLIKWKRENNKTRSSYLNIER